MDSSSLTPPMRRQDRALTTDEAYALLAEVPFATLSMVTETGEPYAVPISPVLCGHTLYFHSAKAGRKVALLARHGRVWMSAVGHVVAATDKFTTYYDSVMACGTVQLVTDRAAQITALRALCEKYTPTNMAHFEAAITASLDRTNVYALPLEHVTGKAKRRKA